VATVPDFLSECINDNPDVVVQKYLINGSSYFFNEIMTEKDEEFYFKKEMAESLKVHIQDIAIVGSGKLGFSIKPDRDDLRLYPFKDFDFNFNLDNESKKSDLDIAIISSRLFDKQLKDIYDHTQFYTSDEFSGTKKKAFGNYILKGWLRPDMMPDDYNISTEIIAVSLKYKKKYNRDVNIGVYKSWAYFEQYHINNINRIKLNQVAI
jgi:Holliday junction resolvase